MTCQHSDTEGHLFIKRTHLWGKEPGLFSNPPKDFTIKDKSGTSIAYWLVIKDPCGLHFQCYGGEQECNIYMVFDFTPVHFQQVLIGFFILLRFVCLGKLIRGTKGVSSTSDYSFHSCRSTWSHVFLLLKACSWNIITLHCIKFLKQTEPLIRWSAG